MTAATEMHMRFHSGKAWGRSHGPWDMPWPCSSLWLYSVAPRTTANLSGKKNSVAPRKSCGGPVALDVQASMQLGPGWLAPGGAVICMLMLAQPPAIL